MPDNWIRLQWTDEEIGSWKAGQRVINEAAVVAGGEHGSDDWELLRYLHRRISLHTTMFGTRILPDSGHRERASFRS